MKSRFATGLVVCLLMGGSYTAEAADTATYYEVWRGASNDLASADIICDADGAELSSWVPTNSFTDTTVVAGQQYYYWVRAITAATVSDGGLTLLYPKSAPDSAVDAKFGSPFKYTANIDPSGAPVPGLQYTVTNIIYEVGGFPKAMTPIERRSTSWDPWNANGNKQPFQLIRTERFDLYTEEGSWELNGAAEVQAELSYKKLNGPQIDKWTTETVEIPFRKLGTKPTWENPSAEDDGIRLQWSDLSGFTSQFSEALPVRRKYDGRFVPVDFSRYHNSNFGVFAPGTAYPTGDQTLGGVPFHIPSKGDNLWCPHFKADGTYDPIPPHDLKSISIPVDVDDVSGVHALINTLGGEGGPGTFASLEFFGSDGAYYKKELDGNSDIRDWATNWTDTINNNTTVEVFRSGRHVLDKVFVDLPAEFDSQTLTRIIVNDNGGTNFQRIFLAGLTVYGSAAERRVWQREAGNAGDFTDGSNWQGGTPNADTDVTIDNGGTAEHRSEATVTVKRVYVAESGSGTFRQSAGVLKVIRVFAVGSEGGSTGTVDVSGQGTLIADEMVIGQGGAGSMNIGAGGAVEAKVVSGNGEIAVNGGALNVADAIDLGSTASLNVNGGSVSTPRVRAGSLSIGGDGVVSISPANAAAVGPSRVFVLSFDGSSDTWEGKLDVGTGDLVIQASAETCLQVLADTINQIKSARNAPAGLWLGNGIISSAARDDARQMTALGVILNDKGNSEGAIYNQFEGQVVDANSILISYTWNGDGNLDGVVNADDYFLIDTGFISQQGGWYNGDFNYDGVVNADDYFMIDSAFLGQTGPLGQGVGLAAVVPEPGAITVLCVGVAAVWVRRRGR